MENSFNREFAVTDDLLASNQQRLANYLIDYVLQFGIGFVIVFLIGIYSRLFGDSGLAYYFTNLSKIQEYFLGIVVLLIYYNLTEIFLKRSIGKFITKTIIVMENGSRPDYQTILLRTICRIIPFNQLSFLGTPCRGWHDSLSKTYVVRKDLFEEKLALFNSFEEIGNATE